MSSSLHPTVELLFLLGGNVRAARHICEEGNVANKWDLTPAGIAALHQVARCKGLKQTELAERMNIEPMTLSPQLVRLEERGLIERRTVSGDRRAKRVTLTQDGHTVLEETEAFLASLFSQASKDIAPEQMARAMDTLTAIQENLNAAEGQIHGTASNAAMCLGTGEITDL